MYKMISCHPFYNSLLVNTFRRKAALAHPDEKVIHAIHVQVLSYFQILHLSFIPGSKEG